MAQREVRVQGVRVVEIYLHSDPKGRSGGINTCAYVNNNPLRCIGPFGLAYLAKRALSGMPLLGPAFDNPGSINDRHNTEVSHEHLFFEDGEAPPIIRFGDGGLFIEASDAGYHDTQGGFNDCVVRTASIGVDGQRRDGLTVVTRRAWA